MNIPNESLPLLGVWTKFMGQDSFWANPRWSGCRAVRSRELSQDCWGAPLRFFRWLGFHWVDEILYSKMAMWYGEIWRLKSDFRLLYWDSGDFKNLVPRWVGIWASKMVLLHQILETFVISIRLLYTGILPSLPGIGSGYIGSNPAYDGEHHHESCRRVGVKETATESPTSL